MQGGKITPKDDPRHMSNVAFSLQIQVLVKDLKHLTKLIFLIFFLIIQPQKITGWEGVQGLGKNLEFVASSQIN